MRIKLITTYTYKILFLHGWAFNRSIGAIHAAITLFWAQHCITVFTFVEKLTGIRRHFFGFFMSAVWAGDGGEFFDFHKDTFNFI